MKARQEESDHAVPSAYRIPAAEKDQAVRELGIVGRKLAAELFPSAIAMVAYDVFTKPYVNGSLYLGQRLRIPFATSGPAYNESRLVAERKEFATGLLTLVNRQRP